MKVHFDIIVVNFNSGEGLKSTLTSIYEQDYWDYDVFIKDAESADESLNGLTKAGFFADEHRSTRTHIYTDKDGGIYDGMNRALSHLKEEKGLGHAQYVIFLNSGDRFYDRQVLGKAADVIEEKAHDANRPHIFYGDQYNDATKTAVTSAPKLNEFALFRNVPCHQVCFYDSTLFEDRGYDTKYRVRADYEHFLYCVYEKMALTVHMDITVSEYEGGGFSETKNGKNISAEEHKEITDRYMGERALRYRLIMAMTGAGLRTRIAENPRFAGVYNRIKTGIYKRR
ncbi:MAG: glycosyltransferase [Lachnospiraceae bacterium]|nr:glycosyltransferase [Lachnospiraceae bacterium]